MEFKNFIEEFNKLTNFFICDDITDNSSRYIVFYYPKKECIDELYKLLDKMYLDNKFKNCYVNENDEDLSPYSGDEFMIMYNFLSYVKGNIDVDELNKNLNEYRYIKSSRFSWENYIIMYCHLLEMKSPIENNYCPICQNNSNLQFIPILCEKYNN